VEDLISLLTNNFHFVIIAIGIIYSLFFRKSQTERPRTRWPDVGGDGEQRSHRSEQSDIPDDAAPTHTRATPVEAPFPELRQTVLAADTRREPPIAAQAAVAAAADRKGSEATSPGLSGTELSRAVMWAEILGPPRARRPYRR
jgi:hypothetical protein